MRLPRNFNKITIDQFQRCPELTVYSNTDEWIEALSVLSGKSIAEIEDIDLRLLKKHIGKIGFLLNPKVNIRKKRYLILKGNLYRADFEANKINTAQGIDIKTFLKHDSKVTFEQHVIDVSHKLLACIYRKFNWKKLRFEYQGENHEEISNDFLSVKVGSVYGTLFFYSKVWESLMPILADYGEKAAKLISEMMKEAEEWATESKTLKSIGDGRSHLMN